MEKYNREEFEEVMVDIGRVTKVVKAVVDLDLRLLS